ncbi:MAG: ATP-dependent protease ATPase subunit HslU [Candidatus Fermentibacteraceae bacterium]|nr:ATP-dependent protease ATPase subunit HslU [Candidatus Fermentibacteraceae bacterium]MBN2607652.1 ATP-dependent protease ATPase subunit HslU [Candidatus Fermentibacteraceae bacterium]
MDRELTPAQIVKWLDRHVIGQDQAKRAVAIALRNRYRRRHADREIRSEIYPSNLIMMGPTGIGKTEIARRLANLTGAPFVKVEATKYTETGYVGRDVESMVRALVRQAVNIEAEKERRDRKEQVDRVVNGKLVDALKNSGYDSMAEGELLSMLETSALEDTQIEMMLPDQLPQMEIMPLVPGDGFDNPAGENIKKLMQKMIGGRRKRTKLAVSEARERLREDELGRLLEGSDHIARGMNLAQEEGIIFIDEIDKIIGISESKGPEVSRAGVQRDLLPIVEGCTVPTRYGPVVTDHILFIAAGAFHGSSPADLIPELQGRFPMRVELAPLSEDDLFRILTEPENSLLRQYTALLKADGVDIRLSPKAAREVARVANHLNEETEDIGARRLRPVLSYLLDEQLFGAPDLVRGTVTISGSAASSILLDLADRREDGNYIL